MASHEFPVAWSHAKFFSDVPSEPLDSAEKKRNIKEKMKSLNWFNNNTAERRKRTAKLVINDNFQFYTSSRPRIGEWKEMLENCHRIGPEALGYRRDERCGAKKRQPQVSISQRDKSHKKWDLCLVSKNRTRHHAVHCSWLVSKKAGAQQQTSELKSLDRKCFTTKLLNWNIFASFAFCLHLFLLRSFARLLASRARPRTNGWSKRRSEKETKTHQGETNTNTINKWQRSAVFGMC